MNVLLKDEVQSLQIPVKDASTHEAAIKLGAELEASTYMYTDLQRTYTTTNMTTQRVRGASQNDTSGKQMGEDYDHIYVQNYVTSFPTSSADIECMYKGQSILSSASSLVPDPYLYSKSPTRNGDAPMSSSHLQQSLQDILDSDYEEIIDTR